MKKSTIFVSSFFLLVTVFSPTPSNAIFGNFLNLRQEVKSDIKLERQENKEDRKEKRQENQDKNLEDKRSKTQAVIKRLRQGIVNRYENTLKHKVKIEARLAVKNNTEAKAKLATFSDTKYKSDFALFDAKSVEISASSTPLKLTPELKTIAKSLQSDIKTMRQVLADTLRLIIKSR